MSQLGHIQTERVSVDVLKPAPYNPRQISDKARQGLSNSIDSFGLLQPIIWNKQTGHVIGGHQRLYDIIAKGAKDTDVIVVNFSPSKEKSANIALNNPGISGQYDPEKLHTLLSEIDDTYMEALNFADLELPEFEPLQEKSGHVTLNFKLSPEQYTLVKSRLAEINTSPEIALLTVLGL